MATYIKSHGALLKVTISATPTTISNRVTINGPSMSKAEIDVTNLDSTCVTTAPGLPDYGEVSCEFNFDPDSTNHQYLLTSFVAGTSDAWSITFTDATPVVYSFSGWISGLDYTPAAGYDDKAMVTMTVRVTSAMTLS